MKFTLSWLKDYLETDAALDRIVDTMIAIGLEIEHVHDPAKTLEGFLTAEVLDAQPHPDADKLQVCTVSTGSEIVEVVCGAPNARKGLKGIFAPVGSYIPGIDLTLSKARIRGVESHGMLCSERELELSEEHDGIIDLPTDTQVGQPAARALGLDDPVIDFEVTPNRPDTCGVAGVARDLAAAGLGKLKSLSVRQVHGKFPCPVDIGLRFSPESTDACPVFAGRVIRGVKNGPSPDWLQKRLRAVGLRPINALVDITNYVSFDRARPLHAYDATRISGEIHARLAREGEKLLALDEKEYDLTTDMCVIADESGVLGLGGVMGGASTASTHQTTDVFIESAYFDPRRTARTGRATAIESDARYRFERGIDPASVFDGLELATRLVLEICGGEPSEIRVAGTAPTDKTKIDFDPQQVKRLTGLEVTRQRMVEILHDLGFETDIEGGRVFVAVPTWRPDIEGQACLVEEIARIHGYDQLPLTPLQRPHHIARPVLSHQQNRTRLARRTIAQRGLTEAVTWSFVSSRQAAPFGDIPDRLRLRNPISSELDVMRPSILPGLLLAVGRNQARGLSDLALFEVGPQYRDTTPDGQDTVATGVRAGVVDGQGSARHWSGGADPVSVFTAKADALAVLSVCDVKVESVQVTADAPNWYHPGRSGVLRQGPRNVYGYFGELHPRLIEAFDLKGPVAGFELFIHRPPVPRAKGAKTKPALDAPSLMPVERDFAFEVDQEVEAAVLIRAARAADKTLIADVTVFDVYSGENVEPGKKSLAIAVTLQPREKTLTDADIEAVSAKIVQTVENATNGSLRR